MRNPPEMRWSLLNLRLHGLSVVSARVGQFGLVYVGSCRCGRVFPKRVLQQVHEIQGAYDRHLDEMQAWMENLS